MSTEYFWGKDFKDFWELLQDFKLVTPRSEVCVCRREYTCNNCWGYICGVLVAAIRLRDICSKNGGLLSKQDKWWHQWTIFSLINRYVEEKYSTVVHQSRPSNNSNKSELGLSLNDIRGVRRIFQKGFPLGCVHTSRSQKWFKLLWNEFSWGIVAEKF